MIKWLSSINEIPKEYNVIQEIEEYKTPNIGITVSVQNNRKSGV